MCNERCGNCCRWSPPTLLHPSDLGREPGEVHHSEQAAVGCLGETSCQGGWPGTAVQQETCSRSWASCPTLCAGQQPLAVVLPKEGPKQVLALVYAETCCQTRRHPQGCWLNKLKKLLVGLTQCRLNGWNSSAADTNLELCWEHNSTCNRSSQGPEENTASRE